MCKMINFVLRQTINPIIKMKKVFALIAFTAIFSASTFAQDAKVSADKNAPAATEKKAACCAKTNAACCKSNKEAKACTPEQKASCAKASKSCSHDAAKETNGTK